MVVVWVDNAENKEDAKNKAKNALADITLANGPIQIRPTAWSCSYNTNEGYIIRAVNSEGPWIRKVTVNRK